MTPGKRKPSLESFRQKVRGPANSRTEPIPTASRAPPARTLWDPHCMNVDAGTRTHPRFPPHRTLPGLHTGHPLVKQKLAAWTPPSTPQTFRRCGPHPPPSRDSDNSDNTALHSRTLLMDGIPFSFIIRRSSVDHPLVCRDVVRINGHKDERVQI